MSDALAAIGRTPDPDPAWPVWDVEMLHCFGTFAGHSEQMPAPDARTAIRWVRDKTAGTRFRPSRLVDLARLHPDHPRFAATEAARRALAPTTRELEEVE